MSEVPHCVRCGKPMHIYEKNPAFYICDAPNEDPNKDCSKFNFLETAKNSPNGKISSQLSSVSKKNQNFK